MFKSRLKMIRASFVVTCFWKAIKFCAFPLKLMFVRMCAIVGEKSRSRYNSTDDNRLTFVNDRLERDAVHLDCRFNRVLVRLGWMGVDVDHCQGIYVLLVFTQIKWLSGVTHIRIPNRILVTLIKRHSSVEFVISIVVLL